MKEKSAQSTVCKRSVHVNEMMRRILNTSARLNWADHVAPVLTDYCVRMKLAGYDQHYRKKNLQQTLQIYDRMVEEENREGKPIHRPKDLRREERRKERRGTAGVPRVGALPQ